MNENSVGTVAGESRYRHLVEHIQDAVVEFDLQDDEPIIEDVNEAFVDVFGYDSDNLLGESLNDWIVPEWLREEARELDRRTASGEINYKRVKRETATGLREFLYRSIPYEGEAGGVSGFAVYTDLSTITRKERRLQVMNRVLRHNLRNSTNIIVAHTTRLLDELDEQTAETTEAAAAVERAASQLETLTQEVTDVRRVLSAPESEVPGIDCIPLLQRIAQQHRRQSPQADIDTVLPESLPVNANEDLELAIDQLVDNAVKHNPATTPRVRVRATDASASGWATICVEDDGPEIPVREREVITGDAEITATQHGTGLGLWLVKWTTDLFGGDLSFSTSDLGGNSVRMRLPKANGDPDAVGPA
jgi:PAS domain S-box-containing protein